MATKYSSLNYLALLMLSAGVLSACNGTRHGNAPNGGGSGGSGAGTGGMTTGVGSGGAGGATPGRGGATGSGGMTVEPGSGGAGGATPGSGGSGTGGAVGGNDAGAPDVGSVDLPNTNPELPDGSGPSADALAEEKTIQARLDAITGKIPGTRTIFIVCDTPPCTARLDAPTLTVMPGLLLAVSA